MGMTGRFGRQGAVLWVYQFDEFEGYVWVHEWPREPGRCQKSDHIDQLAGKAGWHDAHFSITCKIHTDDVIAIRGEVRGRKYILRSPSDRFFLGIWRQGRVALVWHRGMNACREKKSFEMMVYTQDKPYT